MKGYFKNKQLNIAAAVFGGLLLAQASVTCAAAVPEVAEHNSGKSFLEKAAQYPEAEKEHVNVDVDSKTKEVVADETKIKKVPLTKKQRLDRDFFGVDKKGRKIAMRYPGTAKNVEDVPDWSIASIVKLSDYGLLSPDDVREMLSEPERELMAKLTARAYHLLSEHSASDNYDTRFELGKLFKEYDTELRNLGYGALNYASYTPRPVSYAPEIGGELRYNYVDHTGDHPYNFYDHRIRFRPYIKQMLDDNWYVYGMGEAIKSWVRHDIKNFSLIRLFVGGKYKDVNIRAGRYGEYYADGNIYDGRMDGISFDGGETIKYKASYGRLRNGERGGMVMAKYSDAKYEAEAGLYSFDNIKGYGSDTIFAFGGMYYIGNFGTGAMYFKSTKSDVSGASDGYVVTLKYGRHRTSVPGTYEFFAKYYDQADTTYISHTMSGLADYMDGYSGHSVGMYYTFAKNWEYAIEYYDLKEKKSGRQGRTLWNHVSYFFD